MMDYLGDSYREPKLPSSHKPRQFRSEREYNEWRREAYPRYLMRPREGVLRRILRHLPHDFTLRRVMPRTEAVISAPPAEPPQS